uniref:Ras-GAP domain-containing protein n=1 Tax=Hymenolepis diminuta TaxID=6216 RepID=A0A0R3S820_HYMDI
LLDVFSSFRAALEPSKGAEFCDKLISACIFLRFVCPAILTPSLFGLASTFPGESNCQRNLTLVAKSLQSLANLSTFGDKEFFMRFMNAYVEAQIPVMRRFLRDISSLPGVLERSTSEHTTSPVASNIDCGYELACLQNICQELLNPPNGQQNPSSTSSIFLSGNTTSPTESLPPSLSRLPKIIAHLENLKNGIGLPANDFMEGRVTSDSSYASVNSTKRLPALAMPYATSYSVKSDILNPLPRFYLPMEESTSDFSSASVPRQSIPDLNAIGSPIAKPKAVRPTTVRLPGSDGYQHQSNLSDVVMTSPKKTIPFGEDKTDDRVTMRELLKGSAFRRNSGGGRHDVDYDDPYTDEVYDSTHASRRRTTYDAPYEGEDKSGGSGGQMTSSSGASPVHTLQFPSPPYSAFSLYRRPFVPNSPEALQMECSTSSPLTAPPAPSQINTLAISRSSSGIASAEQSSPRKTHQHHGTHHHHSTVARDPLKTTTSATPSNSENVILEPRPNPIITHFRSHLSRSSTASSSLTNNNKQESSTTSTTQHHYPYRQVTNASLAINHPPPTVTSLIATPGKSTTTAQKKSSSAVGTSIFPMDYDFGDYYAGQAAIDDMGTMGTSSSSWNFETDNRRQLSVKKNSEQSEASGYGPTQPVPAENEQLLTSTLEELGDAVAWLERERNDLLSMQERRLSNNRSRSRPIQSPNYAPLTLPSKGPSLTIQTPIVSEISPPTSKTTQLRLHPHTSTPSLHWLNYNPDESSVLTKSTNSLIEHTHPQHKTHRSAVSKTFTLTRSGSASVSPRRSRESSDSSDTHPTVPVRRQRTTTLVLSKPSVPGVATTVVGTNGPVHRSSPQTPVGIRRLSNKNDCSDELEFVVLHPHRPRPHPQSYVSTSNCNIFTPNNASQNQSKSQASTTQRRTTGGVYILSSSPLTS